MTGLRHGESKTPVHQHGRRIRPGGRGEVHLPECNGRRMDPEPKSVLRQTGRWFGINWPWMSGCKNEFSNTKGVNRCLEKGVENQQDSGNGPTFAAYPHPPVPGGLRYSTVRLTALSGGFICLCRWESRCNLCPCHPFQHELPGLAGAETGAARTRPLGKRLRNKANI